ncbi:hypothetical protein P692DRAFT_20723509, partial [Suillus brevipes Sb2]
KTASHLYDAVKHFLLVLDQCPVGHPDRAAALTNLACARLEGYIQKDFQEVDTTTSLFRKALALPILTMQQFSPTSRGLALRPQCHPDHPYSLYNLSRALIWRHSKKSTAVDIRETA